jgi:DNA invertase Pin-like site-specific DNA recombinase
MQDAARKGRIKGGNPGGPNTKWAKLTDAQVREIRSRYQLGGVSQQQLADEFGLSQVGVSKVIRWVSYTRVSM